ncbi:hypothetical protein OS493_024264 [Desmophyllum pertusum]|uniref:Uncharacterized protein n=1 Tax=Desmophyllum pertusum TaxID=174260 RepID=A0A9W9Z0S8_9CNID|nr:hypothetical protein OS493_024264 [Desmophyllum pertusum]
MILHAIYSTFIFLLVVIIIVLVFLLWRRRSNQGPGNNTGSCYQHQKDKGVQDQETPLQNIAAYTNTSDCLILRDGSLPFYSRLDQQTHSTETVKPSRNTCHLIQRHNYATGKLDGSTLT